jgi:hypothetical protein
MDVKWEREQWERNGEKKAIELIAVDEVWAVMDTVCREAL